MSFISMKESQGSKTASLMKQYKNNVDRPVGAILSLNTIAHTIGSAGVGAESMKLFGEEYFGLISAILTLLILVLSEIIPKTIGASYWRSLAMPSTKIIRVLIFITYPLVLLSELITKVFTPKAHQASVSREEVSAMVDVGTTEGIFRESESKIIKSCIRLAAVKAREVMTPSIVVESANLTRAGIHADGMLKNHEIYNIFDTDTLLDRPPKVSVNSTSGIAGVGYWINQYRKKKGMSPVDKKSPLVRRVYDWVQEQYDEGRITIISDAELTRQTELAMEAE
jgi:CBS domain containing-hemolysin-like protein